MKTNKLMDVIRDREICDIDDLADALAMIAREQGVEPDRVMYDKEPDYIYTDACGAESYEGDVYHYWAWTDNDKEKEVARYNFTLPMD